MSLGLAFSYLHLKRSDCSRELVHSCESVKMSPVACTLRHVFALLLLNTSQAGRVFHEACSRFKCWPEPVTHNRMPREGLVQVGKNCWHDWRGKKELIFNFTEWLGEQNNWSPSDQGSLLSVARKRGFETPPVYILNLHVVFEFYLGLEFWESESLVFYLCRTHTSSLFSRNQRNPKGHARMTKAVYSEWVSDGAKMSGSTDKKCIASNKVLLPRWLRW